MDCTDTDEGKRVWVGHLREQGKQSVDFFFFFFFKDEKNNAMYREQNIYI